ncbi:MAG TPA: DNA primase [Solirubrobacteraceae bacterium]|nr:DNA primase [Solirubrobacteraceae bacterium]
MARYTADSRDRVHDAVDMVALVSDKTELRRAGVNSYFGRCPFHEERTGSFHVSPDEKLYHCFGCQASGNPFTFVMETEGLDFKGALESLAQRFGVQLQTEDEDPAAAARRQRRERLYTLLDRAATYYSRYLWEAGEAAGARDYLLGRGLEEQTLREFRVGYAPSAWDRILLASRKAGFSDEELLAVGLAQRSRRRPGTVYDRFQERIMFPAVDARGRVHGFGARRMREDQRGAKYVNTSDGELYHTREVLFGIDLARAAAARAGRMILVEGYTDVLALHQAGIRNAVGIMGTSLTEEQVAELERVVRTLELCLDADRAGQEAMVRAARVAAGRQLELRVVPLPEGTDPADLVEREGAEALRALVARSEPFVVFNVARILDRTDTGSAEGRDAALAELQPLFLELGPSVLRDDLVRRVAGRLELTEARLAGLLAADGPPRLGRGGPGAGPANRGGRGAGPGPGFGPGRGPANGGGAAGGMSQATRSERLFLALCIAVPEQGAAALAAANPDELLTSSGLRRAARHLAEHVRTPLSELPSDDDEFARTISGLVELAGRVPDPSADRLEHARLVLELERLERAIIRARHAGAGTSELARERERVRESMRAVVARLESTL